MQPPENFALHTHIGMLKPLIEQLERYFGTTYTFYHLHWCEFSFGRKSAGKSWYP